MEIDGRFYRCVDCWKWQPWMGDDVSCDCGYSNDFTDDEIEQLDEAAEEAKKEVAEEEEE